MKMTTAGKFVSGCDATKKSTYQLQGYLYSGFHANPYVARTMSVYECVCVCVCVWRVLGHIGPCMEPRMHT